MQAALAGGTTQWPSAVSTSLLRLVTPVLEEAQARLEFLVTQRLPVGLVLGPAGCGKTLLAQLFQADVRRRLGDGVLLNALGMDQREFWWTVASQLGVRRAARDTRLELWRGVADRLVANRYERRPVVLLVDDLHTATNDVRDGLLKLVNFAQQAQVPLTSVVLARSERLAQLDAELLERVELRVELEPWNAAETAAYMQGLSDRQGVPGTLVSRSSIDACRELAAGSPRVTAQLTGLALVAWKDAGPRSLDGDLVAAVHGELAAPVSGAAPSPRRAS